jgi:hypothetical protein
MSTEKLSGALLRSIPAAKDYGFNVAKELAESSIDTFIKQPEFAKSIPFVGVLVSLYKGVISIRDAMFCKKIGIFIFAISETTEEERENMLWDLDNNEDIKQRAEEAILYTLEKADNNDKARLHGLLFKKHLKKLISSTDFFRLSSIVNSIFICDLYELPKYNEPLGSKIISSHLHSLGLLVRCSGFNNDVDVDQDEYKISKLGKQLLECLEIVPAN